MITFIGGAIVGVIATLAAQFTGIVWLGRRVFKDLHL